MSETAQQKYVRLHPERVRANNRKSARKHQDTHRAWVAANKERYAFLLHRAGATRRGIPFLISFQEWIEWWGADFEKRGHKGDDLVMARRGDTGPYFIGNIEKITARQNSIDREALHSQIRGVLRL